MAQHKDIYGSLIDSVFVTSELGCYVGVLGVGLSAVIAWKLLRMEILTWTNKMFLLYMTLDVILGSVETYLFFKLYREK